MFTSARLQRPFSLAAAESEADSGEGILKRVVTGTVLVPTVIYLVLYTSATWILAAASVITLLGLIEFNNLSVVRIRDSWSDLPGILAGVSVPPLFYFYGKGHLLPLLTGSLFVFFLVNMVRAHSVKDAASEVAFKTLGVVYIALPLSYLALLRNLEKGEWWILFLLSVIWANDTFAYLIGKSVGKHRLAPLISPKKTVEGAVGGILGGMLAAALYNRYLFMGLKLETVLMLALAFGVTGMIGDLSESLLKRSAGVKDSGNIVPGHGGVLDRVDSLLFSIPALYYFLVW